MYFCQNHLTQAKDFCVFFDECYKIEIPPIGSLELEEFDCRIRYLKSKDISTINEVKKYLKNI